MCFLPLPFQFLGVRLLRQDPTECLFSFICSSNNNIARITGMVERLCQAFGPRLIQLDDVTYHGFPSLQALAGESVGPPEHLERKTCSVLPKRPAPVSELPTIPTLSPSRTILVLISPLQLILGFHPEISALH